MIIHVGKCGGSNIYVKFKKLYNKDINYLHLNSNLNSIINADHVTILIRDPITRVISIFYYYYYLDTINPNRFKFTKYFKYFKTINELAEALDSDNIDIKNMAHLIFEKFHNLNYNYNFYYLNINFLKEIIKKKYFVIRQENYREDFKIYHDFLIKKFNIENSKIEEFHENICNNTKKYDNKKNLSERAVNNLKNKLKTEYDVFNQMCELNIISKEYINSFINKNTY